MPFVSKVTPLRTSQTSLRFHEAFPSYSSTPLHSHLNNETFFVAKGSGFVYMEGNLISINQGMSLTVTKGVRHVVYTSDYPLECVVTIHGKSDEELKSLWSNIINLNLEPPSEGFEVIGRVHNV